MAIQNDPRLIKGNHSYGNPEIYGDKTRILAGNFCCISDFAVLDAGFNHGSDYISQFPFWQKMPGLEHLRDRHPLSYGDTIIGHGVWIADRAFIRSGVRIGDGAIIGYGAILTGDVRPFAVMVGSPAKEVRRRYSEEQIADLQQIAWWNWPDEKIIANADLLMSEDIEEFIKRHRI